VIFTIFSRWFLILVVEFLVPDFWNDLFSEAEMRLKLLLVDNVTVIFIIWIDAMFDIFGYEQVIGWIFISAVYFF
jgi:hypothetical protein